LGGLELTAKKKPDILLSSVIVTAILLSLYVIWCWIAKIHWQIEPPEGTSVAALAASVSEFLGCALIQAVKKFASAKPDGAAEIKKLAVENRALKKQLEKVSQAAGQLKFDT
jgi:hypothetical protein